MMTPNTTPTSPVSAFMPGLIGAGGTVPFGSAAALLASGAGAPSTPQAIALRSAQDQLDHFMGQLRRTNFSSDTMTALERNLEAMRQTTDQPLARLQALRGALTNLETLGQAMDLPVEARGYLGGLQERLQQLAQIAGT